MAPARKRPRAGEPLRLAVMGAGRWGVNVVRTLSRLAGVELAWIADPDPQARERAAAVSPSSRVIESVDRALLDVHAVVICTPAAEHFVHGSEILEAGKHALVEKPLATAAAEARSLSERADEDGLTLMVGHQLLFHPLFTELERLVRAEGFGPLREIHAERAGVVDFESEPDVLWAYGPHDISMIIALAGEPPARLSGTGTLDAPSGAIGEAAISFEFAGDLVAHIELNGASPVRRRRLTVVGEGGRAVFSDDEPGGRLTVEGRGRVEFAPDAARMTEPLTRSCRHFVRCVTGGERPRTCGDHGQLITALIERVAAEMTVADRAVRRQARGREHRGQTA